MLASLRSVAAVWKEARSQVESLDERIRALLEANAPALLGIEGCGTTTAAALVVAAGDNPGRLKGEAAFSMLCGVSPIPASVSVNIIFTISTNAFSPIAPTRIRRIRQRGCAAFGA